MTMWLGCCWTGVMPGDTTRLDVFNFLIFVFVMRHLCNNICYNYGLFDASVAGESYIVCTIKLLWTAASYIVQLLSPLHWQNGLQMSGSRRSGFQNDLWDLITNVNSRVFHKEQRVGCQELFATWSWISIVL